MKISFAITTHNEGEYFEKLSSQLSWFIGHTILGSDRCDKEEYEIVVLDDFSTDLQLVSKLQILNHSANSSYCKVSQRKFEKDFAAHKNYLNSLCTGDYIFQIDADEILADNLLLNLHYIIENNQTVDLFMVPRVNKVTGLTPTHIAKWEWKVDEHDRVMWPDWQGRIYRNSPEIKWESAVHERIVGAKIIAALPAEEEFALIHLKDIDRQEKQNALYETIK